MFSAAAPQHSIIIHHTCEHGLHVLRGDMKFCPGIMTVLQNELKASEMKILVYWHMSMPLEVQGV